VSGKKHLAEGLSSILPPATWYPGAGAASEAAGERIDPRSSEFSIVRVGGRSSNAEWIVV
jgi:hypothetical protein